MPRRDRSGRDRAQRPRPAPVCPRRAGDGRGQGRRLRPRCRPGLPRGAARGCGRPRGDHDRGGARTARGGDRRGDPGLALLGRRRRPFRSGGRRGPRGPRARSPRHHPRRRAPHRPPRPGDPQDRHRARPLRDHAGRLARRPRQAGGRLGGGAHRGHRVDGALRACRRPGEPGDRPAGGAAARVRGAGPRARPGLPRQPPRQLGRDADPPGGRLRDGPARDRPVRALPGRRPGGGAHSGHDVLGGGPDDQAAGGRSGCELRAHLARAPRHHGRARGGGVRRRGVAPALGQARRLDRWPSVPERRSRLHGPVRRGPRAGPG